MRQADARARVVAALRDALHAGRMRPGARLPTERALAAQEHCDRRTARAALDLLEADGLVRRLSPHVRVVAHPFERTPAVFMRNSVALITEQSEWEGQSAGQLPSRRLREIDVGVMNAAQHDGLHVLTFNRSRLDMSELSSALALRPRGVLITEAALLEGDVLSMVAPLCRKRGTPLVACSDEPELQAIDRVVCDHAAGAELLVAWLAARGCRRILPVGVSPDANYWVVARMRGYAEGCRRAGVVALPRVQVPAVFWVEKGRAELERAARLFAGYLAEWLVPERIDAVMAQNDVDAVLVSEACRILDVPPARRPVVTGYDAIAESHPILHWSACRPAATIEKHNAAQGAQMLALALERGAGKLPQGAVRRLVPPKLVVRGERG